MGGTSRTSLRGCTALAVAIAAFGGSAGVNAEQPPAAVARDYVFDAARAPARTGITRHCVRTGTWTAATGSPCEPTAAASEAEPAVTPAPAQTAAAPAPSPPPSAEPEFYPQPEPKDMVPVPPMTASTEADDRISDPLWYYDEDQVADYGDGITGRWVNRDFDEQVAAAEAEARQEAALAQAQAAASTPPKPAVPVAAKPYVVRTLTLDVATLFAFDQYEITPLGQKSLGNFVRELADLQYGTIQVVGHTDRIGSAKHNLKLSRERANAVKRYLEENGIEPGRVVARGVGATAPVTKANDCSNKLKRAALIDCLRPDRRVEVQVLAKQEN